MESLADHDDGPLDNEEIYPCQGCGDILEEGKAFELAGNRWHLTCFRCNTCGELLDSDANLLLLGDGSLICNNCTYSCSACNNKIEDLAILTGDQAFCASCFRCRNCKRKIENLRYARTSQGIFCMSCHESLMVRRKKKPKKSRVKKDDIEKLLPDLPPDAPDAQAKTDYSSERKTSEHLESNTRTELSPRPHQGYMQTDSSSRSSSRRPRDRSTERASGDEFHTDGMKLLARTYRKNRHSAISQASDLSSIDNESFFIPLALDTNSAQETRQESLKKSKDNKFLDKDYFALSRPSSKTQNERGKSSHQSSAASTPHAMFRDSKHETPVEDRAMSMDGTLKIQAGGKSSLSKTATPPRCDDTGAYQIQTNDVITRSVDENFTLSEPPKSKNLLTRNDSLSESQAEYRMLPAYGEEMSTTLSHNDEVDNLDNIKSTSLGEKLRTSSGSLETRSNDENENWPSLNSSAPTYHSDQGVTTKSLPKKDSSTNSKLSQVNVSSGVDLSPSSASSESPVSVKTMNNRTTPGNSDTAFTISDDHQINKHFSTRPPLVQQQQFSIYTSPRLPPPPPPPQAIPPARKEVDELPISQGLPRWSQGGGDFTMDEDFARILGEQDDQSQSLLHRVSKNVRHGKNASEIISSGRVGHGRSASETTTRTTQSSRWPKSSKFDETGVLHEIGNSTTVTFSEENAHLRRQLRNTEQRVAELEHQFSTEIDLKKLVMKVQEKRKTVSVLDSQTEIMIQQIEILSRYLEGAKDLESGHDFKLLENTAVKDFAMRLKEIKQSVTDSIELLYEKRNDLLEEKAHIMADRDRALLEFEQLSTKNAQLAEMNNDLTQQLQERFKSHSISIDSIQTPLNGLGIYSHPSKNKSSVSIHLDDISLRPSTSTTFFSTSSSYPQAMEQDASFDPTAVLSAPHIVNMRKGQATKRTFNWKKGRQTVAKGVSKGIKGAFSSTQQQTPPSQELNRWQFQNGDGIGLPYIMTQSGTEALASSQTQSASRNASIDQKSQSGFGLFKKSNTAPKISFNGTSLMSEKPSVLFGSELCERADYERRQIPSVVTRCIEEVELRGMDIEGIYRKTGGNSQVKLIQEGFERVEDFDISDPVLDITAVTSALKQYFRKLPTPLLTFDVYDRILESTSIENVRERCLHLRETLSMLPPKHKDCLEFLIFHLTRVAVREKENLMSPKNLAVVFAPTIMRDTSLEREMTDMHTKNGVVQFIIENSYDIFGAP